MSSHGSQRLQGHQCINGALLDVLQKDVHPTRLSKRHGNSGLKGKDHVGTPVHFMYPNVNERFGGSHDRDLHLLMALAPLMGF